MAGRTVNKTKEDTTDIEPKPLNLEEKISLKNLANWMVGFTKIESLGEINIAPNGSIRVSRGEIITQFDNGNRLLIGIGKGKHATIFIDDEDTRKYLDIDSVLIDEKLVKLIFNIKRLDDFENKIKDTFVTRTEKIFLINCIKNCKFNDYNKVRFCESYTGINV